MSFPSNKKKQPIEYAVGEFVPLDTFLFGRGTVSKLRLVSKPEGRPVIRLCFEAVFEREEQTGWRRTE